MGQNETRKIVVLGCVYLLKCQNGMVYLSYGKRTQHRTENGGYHCSGRGLLYPFHFPQLNPGAKDLPNRFLILAGKLEVDGAS